MTRPSPTERPPRLATTSKGRSPWSEVSEQLRQGHFDLAERALEHAIRVEPNLVGEALVRARIVWERGEYAVAVTTLRAALDHHPRAVPLHAALAELYLLLDRPELALEWATSAKQLEPTPATVELLKRVTAELFLEPTEKAPPPPVRLKTPPRHSDAEVADRRAELATPDGGGAAALNPAEFAENASERPLQHPYLPLDEHDEGSRLQAAETRVLHGSHRSMMEARQIDAILCSSLFPLARDETFTHLGVCPVAKGRFTWTRVAVGVLVASFVLGAGSLATVGLERKARQELNTEAEELRQLLAIGSFEHAERLLAKLEAAGKEAEGFGAKKGVVGLAHVLLHRYHDQDPSRIERARSVIGAPGAGLDLVPVVEAWLALEEGQPFDLEQLERLGREHGKEPHAAMVLALFASRAGDQSLAERSFSHAEAIEPTHLAYLFEQVEHFLHLGKAYEAGEAIARMNDVSPTSPWTRLARAHNGELSAEELQALRSATELPPAIQRLAVKTSEVGRGP